MPGFLQLAKELNELISKQIELDQKKQKEKIEVEKQKHIRKLRWKED